MNVLRNVSRRYVSGIGALSAIALLAGLPGCSTSQWKEKADAEVYSIIDEKAPAVPGLVKDFDIDPVPPPELGDLPIFESAPEFLGEYQAVEEGAGVISLERALLLAFTYNRTYLTQREGVYLTALNLTNERNRFTPFFSAGGNALFNRTTRDVGDPSVLSVLAAEAPALVTDIGNLTGQPAELFSRYSQIVDTFVEINELDQPGTRVIDEDSVTGATRVGVDLLLASGAQIAVDLTSNFLRFLTGDPRVATRSALAASITQPLLRGAGRRVVQEQLTQAERDLLYALRSYTRFRQEFAVSIASQYYRVLQGRDQVRNNYQGYLALQQQAEREDALAQFGRATATDVGRTSNALLSAEDDWVGSISNYTESLDNFKILLGLPTDAHVILDPEELEALIERGLEKYEIDTEQAVTIGLATRLDLYNVRDEVEDAERRVVVAKNALLPDIDIIADAAVSSTGADNFQELDFERAAWSAGLAVDLPLERKAERNNFRAALISEERARRDRELAEDEVKLDVRGAWRNLDEARRTYQIQLQNVEINQRRVELEELKAELGRATALDQIDAQNALIASRNALTAALVGHNVARLEFWRDMGILYIKPNGQWEDVTDAPST
jgi:outer membrane protein TolC